MKEEPKGLGERQKRLRRRRRRTKIILAGLFLLLPLAGWGTAYGFAEDLVEVSPDDGIHLASSSPVVLARWRIVPGVRLVRAKVVLDGKDISETVSAGPLGFRYDPVEGLPEGRHVLKTKLSYRIVLIRRDIEKDRLFVTDTVAPAVELDGSVDGVLGTPRRTLRFAGKTEGLAQINARYEGKKVDETRVDGTGAFVFRVGSVGERGRLVLTAVDRAGNKSSKSVSVIYDTAPPEIVSLSPAPGSTVRGFDNGVAVNVRDGGAGVRAAGLRIDGQPVEAGYSPETSSISFKPEQLADGSHKVAVEVEDGAGNKSTKEWEFTFDSSYIRISLAQRRLFFIRGGQVQATYAVAVGQPRFPTPQGNWKIVGKRKNPTWRNPGAGWAKNMPNMIPPGPDNPLGQRALDLSAPGIRIHGTPNVRSVGTAASHGCLRMIPSQIEVLFDQVGVGTPVMVVGS